MARSPRVLSGLVGAAVAVGPCWDAGEGHHTCIMVFSWADPWLWGFFPSQGLQAVLLVWLALSRLFQYSTGWKGQQNIGTRKKWGHRSNERDLSNKVSPSDTGWLQILVCVIATLIWHSQPSGWQMPKGISTGITRQTHTCFCLPGKFCLAWPWLWRYWPWLHSNSQHSARRE